MKILYIIDSLRSGGKERRLISLIEGIISLDEVNIELIVLSKKIHYKSILSADVKIHFFERDIRKDIKILIKFKKVLNSFRPNIVHGWDNIAAVHFAPICYLKRIPFINSMITAAPKTSKVSKRYLINSLSYPFSDIILSNSQAGLDNLHVPKQKQKVIYNGFSFNRLNNLKESISVLEEFNISRDRPIVGMVASFNKYKDYSTFIRSAFILKDKYSFVTIGDGENIQEMKQLVKKLNLENIYFLGKQTDVESIVNIFDIGVLATYTEGISNAIMEYMALSKPVIATEGGGTKELVIDKETGFLIEKKNEKQLAEKIEFLLENPKFAKEMGEKGKNSIMNKFSIDRMVKETYQLYLEQKIKY